VGIRDVAGMLRFSIIGVMPDVATVLLDEAKECRRWPRDDGTQALSDRDGGQRSSGIFRRISVTGTVGAATALAVPARSELRRGQ
jgi:hypothetical protein